MTDKIDITEQLSFFCSEAATKTIGNHFPILLGKVLGQLPQDHQVQALLHELPSETSKAERYALYHWFRYVWNGAGNCLEIGPFLGGTSRAIALGMLHNPTRQSGAHLNTVDRFGGYAGGDELVDLLAPLFKSGRLPSEWSNTLKSDPQVRFVDIYKHIHLATEYGELLAIEEGTLPDKPQDVSKPGIYTPKLNAPLGTLFIDGCKSWFSVKHLMSHLENNLPEGTFIIPQDYGWFSCFWLPAFFEIFSDHYELLAMVDTSYFFKVTKQLKKDEILKKFPDHPRELGAIGLKNLFDAITEKSSERGDTRGAVMSQMHLACALAIIGSVGDAYKIVTTMQDNSFAKPYVKTIARVLAALDRRFVVDPEQTHIAPS